VDIAQAAAIANALPPFVSTVALFVNAAPAAVAEVISRVRPTLLQFHGDEAPAYCAQFGVPFLKAIRIGTGMNSDDLLEYAKAFSFARALLLDTQSSGAERVFGGSGESFDWRVIPDSMRHHIVLAGGLKPENVGQAVRNVRPWAVDVSSGVEAQRGVKDHARIKQFIEEVRNADAG
jgi:phosphoribosylanthranilate isomerase